MTPEPIVLDDVTEDAPTNPYSLPLDGYSVSELHDLLERIDTELNTRETFRAGDLIGYAKSDTHNAPRVFTVVEPHDAFVIEPADPDAEPTDDYVFYIDEEFVIYGDRPMNLSKV